MKNSKAKEITNINIQIYASYLFILTSILSIFLLYNERSYLKNQKYIVNKRKSYYISYFGRLLALILVLVFLYVNYDNKQIAKRKKEDLKNYDLQIYASIFNLIGAIIVFYIIATSNELENVTDVENPII